MPALSGLDPHSTTWRALKAWAEQELARIRLHLEQPDLDAISTATDRGVIVGLKAFLALADDKPAIPSSDPHY